MADWRPKLKAPATFRGAPFFVESVEFVGGRRKVDNSYPFRDLPWSKDLGRKQRGFPIEGFVIGEDYEAARNKLKDALEGYGPGELVHPHYGTHQVAVGTFRIRESTGEGGVARFSIEFAETQSKPSQPTAVIAAKQLLAASVVSSTLAMGGEFLATYYVGPLLDSVVGALGAIASVKGAINSAISSIEMEPQALANLQRQLSDFASGAVALASEPANLLAANVAIFDALAAGLASAPGAIDAILSLYAFNPGVRPPATTPHRLQEQASFDATHRLNQRLALAKAAQLAGVTEFVSYDDAVTTRAKITALIDDQAEIVADDVYPVLLQLRADLVRAVPGDALELARLVGYTPSATVPSLVLAHRLYGNLSMEADLLARNRVRHPAFIRGGVALEVLSDG